MDRLTPSLLIALFAANFVVGIGAFLVIGSIEPLARDLGVSLGAAGNLMTTYSVAYAVLSPVAVAATGQIGRRRVLTAGMVLFGTATLASTLAPNLGVLHGARAIAALGAGLITPVAAAVAAGLAPPDKRAQTLAVVFTGLTLAQAVGVPVGSWLAYGFGWRLAFGIAGLLALPAAWLLWTRVPAGLRFAPVSLADLGHVLRDGQRMAAILFTASFLAAVFVLFTYVAPLLSSRMGYDRTGVALRLFLLGLGAIAGNLAGGWASDTFGPRRSLIGLCLLQVAVLPLFSALPYPGPVVVALILIWSLMGWSFGPPQQVRLVALDPGRAPVLLSLNAASIYVGMAAGAFVGSLVLNGWGVDALGIAAAFGMVLALVHLLVSDRAVARQRENAG